MKVLALLGLLWGMAVSLVAADRLAVAATTTMVADLVRQVGGERVAVEALMGAGVDPHLYKATPGDLGRLQKAKVVLYNGLHLEGKMQDIFDRLAKGGRNVVAVTRDIAPARLIRHEDGGDHPDPHVWFDVALWADCAGTVAEALAKADPEGKAFYEAQAAKTKASLLGLHDWAKQRAAEVPAGRRVLITSHDAFSYFGRAYGFEVVGLQGISTVSEAGLADMSKLVGFIRDKKVPAIFVESSVPHQAIERISQDAGVKIGGELFSDAMGTPGQMEKGHDLGTFQGMIRHNVDAIVDALK